MKKVIVRFYRENEVMVDETLSEEKATEIAIDLTKQKFEACGVNTDDFEIAILTEV